jgi:hypothetical protein
LQGAGGTVNVKTQKLPNMKKSISELPSSSQIYVQLESPKEEERDEIRKLLRKWPNFSNFD